MARTAIALAAALGAAMSAPSGAFAHGLVGRADLPIPEWLFAWAAAIVLMLSFLALATLWPKPRLEHPKVRLLNRVPLAAEVLCGAVGIAAFVLLVYAGLAGAQGPTDNLLPTSVYVVFWVGLVPVSALFGDVFRAFSPWRAIGRGVGWVTRRAGGGDAVAPLQYPERLGRWPAVAGLAAFGWLELVAPSGNDPSTLAVLALAYAAAQLVGMAFYGVEAWTRRGDTFGVYFAMFARISPLTIADGRLGLRAPLSGLTVEPPVRATVGFLCVAIGITTFDGAAEGALFSAVSKPLQDAALDVGLSIPEALIAVRTIGLIMAVLLVALIWWAGMTGLRRSTSGHDGENLGPRFAHSLVPIACAYVVAHYVSLLVFEGQAMSYLVSDPLGRGSDLFGTADGAIDYGVLSSAGIWYLQVAALVIGHVAALILAHDRALVIFGDTKQAVRSQYWMLAVMVGFTMLGLWLLSQANA